MSSHWPRSNPNMMAAVLAMMALPTEEYRKADSPEEATKRQRLAEERRRLADESERLRRARKEAADAAYRAIADKYREERLERKRIAMEKRKPKKEKIMVGKRARDLSSGTIYHATHENSGDLCRMTDKTEQVGPITFSKAVQLSTNKEFRIHPAAIIWPVEDKP